MPPPRRWILVVLLIVAACGGTAGDTANRPQLPRFDPAAFSARLESAERPAVVNVWASWCIPCRSEAPLLAAAHEQYSDRIDFVGVDIQDTESAAGDFLDEHGIGYENLFDPGAEVRSLLGGSGVPITYFVTSGGDVIETHFGVIDEQELALQIDELLRRQER